MVVWSQDLHETFPFQTDFSVPSLNDAVPEERVGGRLRHANVAYGHKHPILLPKRHILTDLIVRHYHEILLHAVPLSDNINEYEVLTPGHFIIGRPISAIPEPAILDISDYRLSRWQYTTKCVQTLWKRWKNDYLNHLQQRNKWQFEKNNVAVGCLVLLKENDLPPCKWAMARILEVIYGTDGKKVLADLEDEIFDDSDSDCELENEEDDLISAQQK
ncbi:integrase catalytic domain-containing protein [Trichonephila clavipes]|nr:integrase catalytic domain-containing protein [Trichonephila clavipes]